MAILSQPFSIEMVKLFAGVVDFYYWKGIPVARKWPSKPRQPNTPAQVATRQHFKAAGDWLKNRPAPFYDAWSTIDYPVSRTMRSFARGLALRLSHAGQLQPYPIFTSISYMTEWSEDWDIVKIHYDQTWPVEGNPVSFAYRYAQEKPRPIAWHQVDQNVKKRCGTAGTWELDTSGFVEVFDSDYYRPEDCWIAIVPHDIGFIELYPFPLGSDRLDLVLQPPLWAAVQP